jgi:hypothetical protein
MTGKGVLPSATGDAADAVMGNAGRLHSGKVHINESKECL